MDTRRAPPAAKPRDRALPTGVGALIGFVLGLGGGLAGAVVMSVLCGGALYVMTGTKRSTPRPARTVVVPQSAPDPFENTVLDDGEDRYQELLAVLEEALAEGAITETQFLAVSAIARRRMLGEEQRLLAGETDDGPAPLEPPVDRPAVSPAAPPPPAPAPPRTVKVRTARPPEPPAEPVGEPGTGPAVSSAPAWSRRITPPQLELTAVTARLRDLWGTLASDFALHGLAYSGVLLVFVATLGFVVFAFSGVQSGLRPVAEAAIPVMLFGAARFLRHRGAPFVSRALQFLAGAVTPVVAFAAFRDGAGFPPDLDGAPLVVTLAAVATGLAAIYARICSSDSTSPLRFLVAPLIWLAVGVVGLAFHGESSAAQMSLVLVAISGTVLWARLHTRHLLSKPTRDVALPAAGVVVLLLVLFASAAAWPALPALWAGVALLALTEMMLPKRFRHAATAQAVVIVATAALVAPSWGAGVAAAGAAGLFMVFVETWSIRPGEHISVPVGAALGGIALTVAATQPWPVLTAGTVIGIWGHVRRRILVSGDGDPVLGLGAVATSAAVAAPLLAASGLWRIAGPESTVLAAGLVVSAAALAVWRWARSDAFYAASIPAAAAAIVAATVALPAAQPADLAYRPLAAAAALAGVAFAVAPRWPAMRVWFGSASMLWAVVLGLEAAEVAFRLRAPTLAVLGAVTVVAAAAGRDRVFGHLALVGHIVTAGALVGADAGGPALVALAAFTAGWSAETAFTLADRSVLQHFLFELLPDGRATRTLVAGVAPVVAAVSVPFLVADLATFFDVVTPRQRGRMALLQSGLALGYAGLARATVRRRPVAPVMAFGGFFLSAVGIAIAAPEPWPTIAALGASIGVVALIGGELRRSVMTWIAWIMSAVLAVLLGDRAGVAGEHLHYILLAWGGLGFIGGLAVDDIRMGRRSPGVGLRIEWLLRPVALGALAIPVALSVALDAPPAEAWVAMAAAAAVYGIAALQLRAGSVGIVFYALGAYAVGLWLETTPRATTDHPWMLAFFTLGLVIASFGSWAGIPERRAWLRWDVPPLVVAHATALAALLLTGQAGSIPAVFAAHGGIALAVAAWQRRWVWAVAGAGLLLIGAAAAGPGWVALAAGGLAVLSLVSATISARYSIVLQWSSVAFAALTWVEVVVWRAWWPDPALLVTAAAGGVLAAGLAGVVRNGWLSPGGALPWASLAVLAVAGSAGIVLDGVGSRPDAGVGVALGLAGLALASALAAARVHPMLRPLAGVLAGGIGPMLVYGYLPSGGTVAAWAAPVGLATAVGAAVLWRSRSSPWSVPLVVFALLVDATGMSAAAMAGASGWLAVLCGAMAGAAVAGAIVTHDDNRLMLQGGSALLAALAWGFALDWAGWIPEPGVAATIVGAAGVGLVLALIVRSAVLDRSWVVAWGAAALIVSGIGMAAIPELSRATGGLAAAAGFLLWAVAGALAARPLDAPSLREAAALALLASGVGLWYGLELGPGPLVAASLIAGLVATAVAGSLVTLRGESPWIRPAAVYAAGAQLAALFAALQALPETALASAALAAAGIQAVVLGGLFRMSPFLYAGPPLLLISWILFAADAFGGNPQWYTIPIGVTILVLADIVRWDVRRGGNVPVSSEEMAYADYAGMAFMAGASLIQVVTRSSAYGLIAIVAGLVILTWAAAARVRRRAWGGAATIVSAAILIVAVPLARIIPQFRGIALWATLAAIGALLIAMAGTLEQGKARVAEAVTRLDELMEGWE